MRNEADKVAKTATGGRNDAIFIGALKLGSYVAGAGLDEAVVIAALEAAAETNGYTASDGLFATRPASGQGCTVGRRTRARCRRRRPGSRPTRETFEWFWELTDTLRHVRDFAHARLVGYWAVLGVALARAVAKVRRPCNSRRGSAATLP